MQEIAVKGTCGNNESLHVTVNRSSKISPPPFMAGVAEVEVDTETGSVELIDYAAVVDCGTPVNPNLARVQTEGGLAQGIGMALYEDIQYNEKGDSFGIIPLCSTRFQAVCHIQKIRVDFAPSYEKSHPFSGCKIHW